MAEEEEVPLPNLDWILSSELRWIFVGGKGGVGKTTTTCALGTQLARRSPGKRVLIISTDPAHNTSDAFAQKFGSEPTAVSGFENLFAMEIDAKHDLSSMSLPEPAAMPPGLDGAAGGGELGSLLESVRGMMPELKGVMGNVPGIDEAVSFMEIMKQVRSMDYDIVLFDTAPTGHTLRLLAMPEAVEKMLQQSLLLQSRFGGMIGGMMRSFGLTESTEEQRKRLEELAAAARDVVAQFKDPERTTFIPVMIPEFLSLYETERLIQELDKFDMDVSSVVINQLLPDDACAACPICTARARMQAKYVAQAEDLYGYDFHLVRMRLQDHEIRGPEELYAFGSGLFSH